MNGLVFRNRLVGAGLAIIAALLPSVSRAEDEWPSKRISLLVGFAAGGFADTVGRIIANKLGERLKQTVVVQNMEGAGGNIAARQVSVAAADGHTILVTTTGLAINETLFKSKGFEATSLVPLAIPVMAPESLTTSPKSGFRTLAELVNHARTGQIFMGTPGIGSGSHIAAEYFFKVLAKVEVKHIPFQGGNPAKLGLLSGDVNVLATTAAAATVPGILSGEIIGLAVAGAERDPAIPDVPTFGEAGYPGFQASSWVGLFVRAGTPPVVIARLNAEINDIMREPETQAKMLAIGLISGSRTVSGGAEFFKSEIARWAEMVKATGLSM